MNQGITIAGVFGGVSLAAWLVLLAVDRVSRRRRSKAEPTKTEPTFDAANHTHYVSAVAGGTIVAGEAVYMGSDGKIRSAVRRS